ncbi:hypothetical protein BS17DRAFT_780484 [Gyrodon lividus]|nr:hypothetical protein BS17DRAFT_780484 [Gyrodon lividus]
MCPKDTNVLLESGFCTGTLANEYDIVLARRPGEERGYLIDLAVREEQDLSCAEPAPHGSHASKVPRPA